MVEKKQVEIESSEADIRFEPEGRHGLAAEGSYLLATANRFGIFFEAECDLDEHQHFCAVRILQGGELLSAPTQEELDNLSEEARVKGERLACQTRIERAGELVLEIMEKETAVKDDTVLQEEKFQEFRKDFSDLPLQKKVGELMQLEAITLGETFSFMLNLPFTIGDQIMGVMAGFGKEMDKAAKESKRPAEHTPEPAEGSVEESAPEFAPESAEEENDPIVDDSANSAQ
jgi:ferredoxin